MSLYVTIARYGIRIMLNEYFFICAIGLSNKLPTISGMLQLLSACSNCR